MEYSPLLIVAGAWVGIGLILAFVMRRRGHDFSVWLLLGMTLGPLAVPLAIERARYHESRRTHESTPAPRSGLDLLVAIDGSEESLAALHSAIDLFGWESTGVTLATVLDYDSEEPPAAEGLRTEARDLLDRIAAEIRFEPVKTTLLYGPPATALADYALEHGFELIVVGPRGRGTSERLFGSVTAKLVGASTTPVFVGPRAASAG